MAQPEPAARSAVAELAAELIRCPSIAPDDAGAQSILRRRLAALGFALHPIEVQGIHSFWAMLGETGPVFAFSGHTDVVPPGDERLWTSPPFAPEIRDGRLHGRGAADMKGPLAAVIISLERFLKSRSQPLPFRLGLLISGDEEPEHNHGTRDLLELLRRRGITLDYCLVTEPTSLAQLGDVIKIGRRGSMHGYLTVRGVQGHSAHPETTRNPIAEVLPAMLELTRLKWDDGTPDFPPTNLQWTNLNSGLGVANVIPGRLEAQFNIRFSNVLSEKNIQERIQSVLRQRLRDWELRWSCNAQPFLSRPGQLTKVVVRVVEEVSGRTPELSTAGGTSDGRFIAPTGAEVVEFGLVGKTGHMVDESVNVEELEALSTIYQRLLEVLCLELASDAQTAHKESSQ